jgi:hypothetical protein
VFEEGGGELDAVEAPGAEEERRTWPDISNGLPMVLTRR